MAERSPQRIWRNKMLNLVGEVCPEGHKIFPKRDICPDCGHEAHEEFIFSGSGEIYSYTTIYEPPTEFEEQRPYMVALIKLDEGPMLTAQITDSYPGQNIEIGMKVEMVTRKLSENGTGVIPYGYKFRVKEEIK